MALYGVNYGSGNLPWMPIDNSSLTAGGIPIGSVTCWINTPSAFTTSSQNSLWGFYPGGTGSDYNLQIYNSGNYILLGNSNTAGFTYNVGSASYVNASGTINQNWTFIGASQSGTNSSSFNYHYYSFNTSTGQEVNVTGTGSGYSYRMSSLFFASGANGFPSTALMSDICLWGSTSNNTQVLGTGEFRMLAQQGVHPLRMPKSCNLLSWCPITNRASVGLNKGARIVNINHHDLDQNSNTILYSTAFPVTTMEMQPRSIMPVYANISEQIVARQAGNGRDNVFVMT